MTRIAADDAELSPKYPGYGAIVKAAHDAGFRGEALVTATAVALAESGGDINATGDTTITTAVWGPSIGLWQVRSLKAEYGTGRTRDASKLYDAAFNARSAYTISKGGSNFKPWSVYTNGAYKKLVKDARVTVQTWYPGEPGGLDLNLPGSSYAGAGSNGPTTSAFAGPIFSPSLPNDGGMPLRVGGRLNDGELGQCFTAGRLEYAMDEASMLTTSFIDDAYTLADRYMLSVGAVIDFSGSRWQIGDVTVDHRGATPVTTMRSIVVGVKAMKRQSPGTRGQMSPTVFMKAVAQGAKLGFFGEPTAQVASIAPEVKNRGDDPLKILSPTLRAEQLPPQETAWELGKRLADDLGFVMFEAQGTLYFASPAYLFHRLDQLLVAVDGQPGSRAERTVIPVTLPRVTVKAVTWTQTVKAGKIIRTPYSTDLAYDVDLPRETFPILRLGQACRFSGMGPYGTRDSAATTLSQITLDLGDPNAAVTVTTRTNDPRKNKASTVAPSAADPAGTATTPKGASNSGRAVDFVTFALRQKGDRYIYGAEVKMEDPDPEAFDCSELVQWAAAQVGVTIPDGSGNQYSWCVRKGGKITVADAARTRGALLFRGPGGGTHVAISLGDGKSTIEARGRAYGVVQASSVGRFTLAARIPNMRYN